MSESNKPFVVTDRRKFTLDGTPRPDADPSPEPESRDVPAAPPAAEPPLEFKSPSAAKPEPPASAAPEQPAAPDLPPPPTASEMQQANAAYQQTSERLDTAVRAANPSMEAMPAMSFDQIVQSIYMTTILQLGGTTQEGQQPKVDLMGARPHGLPRGHPGPGPFGRQPPRTPRRSRRTRQRSTRPPHHRPIVVHQHPARGSMKSIRSFHELTVWQRAIDMSVQIYTLTRSFPKEELFGLTNQVRRASVSVSSNIAEGQSRLTKPEFIHFLSIARGSNAEVQSQLELARRLNFGNIDSIVLCEGLATEVAKILNALIASLKPPQPATRS
jgi:four helix bundle protein